MNIGDTVSMKEEAKRIHWRLEILQGKHGKNALRRINAMVKYPCFHERVIT